MRQVFPRTAARIDEALLDQLMKTGEIDLLAFTLRIRRERPPNVWPLLPANSQPPKIFDSGRCKLLLGALRIKVLHAKHQLTSSSDRPLIRRPKSSGVANMKISRRRRRDTAAIDGGGNH